MLLCIMLGLLQVILKSTQILFLRILTFILINSSIYSYKTLVLEICFKRLVNPLLIHSCWISSNTSLLYIIHGPICAALLVRRAIFGLSKCLCKLLAEVWGICQSELTLPHQDDFNVYPYIKQNTGTLKQFKQYNLRLTETL